MLISEATVVVSFAQDNFVRLKQSKAEEAYKNIVDAPSAATGAEDSANPAIPRIIIKNDRAGIAVSQISAQLVFMPDKNESLDRQAQSVIDYAGAFFAGTVLLEGELNIRDTGIVASFLIPSEKPVSDLNSKIFNDCSAFGTFGEVVSAYNKTAFKTEDSLIVSVELGTYVRQPGSGAENGSGGYMVRVDVNNKPLFFPSEKSVGAVSPDAVSSRFKALTDGGLKKYFKKGLS